MKPFLLIFFGIGVASVAWADESGLFSCRDLGGGNAEISAYSGNDASLTVPAAIGGKRIVAIGKGAFFGNPHLREVTFPEGLNEISSFAFAHCENLARISLPQSLKKIASHAFFSCGKLPEITLPDNLEFLGTEAFAFCDALGKISAPQSIAHLGENVFPLTSGMLFPETDCPDIKVDSSAIAFSDASGDSAIDGAESCILRVPVTNFGRVAAYGCRFHITLKKANENIVFPEKIGMPKISAGETLTLEVPISASKELAAGTAEFEFSVSEPTGQCTEAQILEIETRPFVAPSVKIVDFLVSGHGESRLKKNKPFDLQVFLQNTTAGRAESVCVSLELPKGILVLDGKQTQIFPALNGGESKPLDFSLLITRHYRGSEIPVRLNLSEKHGEYAESWETTLHLDTDVATTKTVLSSAGTVASSEIELASFRSDVDKEIPVNPEIPERNIFVVIIANENYRYVAPVNFAENDGQIFYEYCRKTLGVPEKQIRIFKNATVGDMNLALNWLETRGKLPEAELIFYYSGHGVQDDASRSAYLLPVDGDPSGLNFLRPLTEIYTRLAASRAKVASVFLDSCFSGMRRDNAPLVVAKGVRRAASAGDISQLPANLVVFTAASGDQTAHFAHAEKHGLFTYVLLKKLKETRGAISFDELGAYLRETVPAQSLKLGDFEQTPNILAHDDFPYWDERLYPKSGD